MLITSDLARPIMFHCCRDRTLTYRQPGDPVFNDVVLPVFSVDTIEEAEELQILVCECVPDEHPSMPNKPWYKIYMGLGVFGYPDDLDLDHLEQVTEDLRKAYKMIKKNKERQHAKTS